MEDPKVDKHERMLMALPSDFKKLAAWGWTDLRIQIYKHAIAQGVETLEAGRMASRLSRLVCTQLYGDITRWRQTARGGGRG